MDGSQARASPKSKHTAEYINTRARGKTRRGRCPPTLSWAKSDHASHHSYANDNSASRELPKVFFLRYSYLGFCLPDKLNPNLQRVTQGSDGCSWWVWRLLDSLAKQLVALLKISSSIEMCNSFLGLAWFVCYLLGNVQYVVICRLNNYLSECNSQNTTYIQKPYHTSGFVSTFGQSLFFYFHRYVAWPRAFILEYVIHNKIWGLTNFAQDLTAELPLLCR